MVEKKPLQAENDDERRTIYAAHHTVNTTLREMAFYVKKPAVLGNHYHKTFQENFLLVHGTATLFTQPVNEQGERQGSLNEETITAPLLVTMPRFTAYAFKFHGPATLICRIDKLEYDVNDINDFKLA